MNEKLKLPGEKTMSRPGQRMKTSRAGWCRFKVLGIVLGLLVLAGHQSLAQTAPVLTIATTNTNQFSITITNALAGDTYEVWWTPALANPNYPWTMLPPGAVGQTTFLMNNLEFPGVFFKGVLDPFTVPLWEQSNPNSPPSPVLTITIANPTNGAVLQ